MASELAGGRLRRLRCSTLPCAWQEENPPSTTCNNFKINFSKTKGRTNEGPARLWARTANMHRKSKVAMLAMLGCAIATYALSVEAHMDEDGYEAMCDISAVISCTEVFRSPYAHPLSLWGLVPVGDALDIGLASAGILLYGAYLLAAFLWDVIPFRKPLFLAVASGSATFSLYLLYVLKFILGDFCIVCTGFHVVNFSMLAVAVFEYRDSATAPSKKVR